MSEKSEQEGWTKVTEEEHELHGVTPDMIDWWFDNMEKGFMLWHPTEHKGFEWEVPPSKVGHVGAVQITRQGQGGSVHEGKIQWEDVSSFPIPSLITLNHVCVCCGQYGPDGKPSNMALHQWEETSYGTRHRFTIIARGAVPEGMRQQFGRAPATQSGPTHPQVEALRWPEFLPELYKMWQVVTDPEINVPCNLKVKKLPNGKYAYEAENKPPKKKNNRLMREERWKT